MSFWDTHLYFVQPLLSGSHLLGGSLKRSIRPKPLDLPSLKILRHTGTYVFILGPLAHSPCSDNWNISSCLVFNICYYFLFCVLYLLFLLLFIFYLEENWLWFLYQIFSMVPLDDQKLHILFLLLYFLNLLIKKHAFVFSISLWKVLNL